MYVPFLCGSKHELQAVEKLAPNIQAAAQSSKHVVPLIEPVKINQTWHSLLPRIGKTGIPFFLIMNPQQGEFVGKTQEVAQATFGQHGADLGSAIPTYVITPATTAQDVSAFAGSYPNHAVAFVVSSWTQNAASIGQAISAMGNLKEVLYTESGVNPNIKGQITPNGGILIHDGFKRMGKNADYPPVSFFSDAHATYAGLGYSGFGDHLMVGADYRAGGGPAAAVALHLTELDPQTNVVMTRHFVSHAKTGAGVNTAGKFLQSVQQLSSYVSGPPRLFPYSTSCDEYIKLAQTNHFPGLGVPKELSMRHHVDLMINQIL